jgi:short-subunit dehydrogenase
MNETVLVTGASSGAGHAIARRFASHGFNVILAARRLDRLQENSRKITTDFNVNATPLQCDLQNLNEVQGLYEKASKIGFSVLINNAGRGDWNFIWDVSVDKLNTLFDLNARAVAVLSALFVRENKDKEACLVNVASLAGYSLFNAAIPYSASKFFVTAFTEGLIKDLELVKSPMRAKLIAPGPIDTEFKSIWMRTTSGRSRP